MSLECSECEHDLRGGHDSSCSRYVKELCGCEHALVNELAYILGPEFLDHHPPLTTREDVIKAVTSLVLERNGKQ